MYDKRKSNPGTWNVFSQESEGFHEVIIPGKSECEAVYMFRLNLKEGQDICLIPGILK